MGVRTHDLMVAVRSTRNSPTTPQGGAAGKGLKPHNPHYTGVLQEETVTSDNPHMLFGPPIKCLLNVLASELTSVAALKEDSLAYCYSQLLGGNGP